MGKKRKKDYDTSYSRVVPHRSTDDARGSLTSEFGWDRVLYARYGRNQKLVCANNILYRTFKGQTITSPPPLFPFLSFCSLYKTNPLMFIPWPLLLLAW